MPLQRRLPKRGFKSLTAGRTAEVRLSDLERMTAAEVDLLVLKQAGVVPQLALAAKVILSGNLTRKVSLKGIGVTKGAQGGNRGGRRQRAWSRKQPGRRQSKAWQPVHRRWPRAAASTAT